jgi:hypothetical protein
MAPPDCLVCRAGSTQSPRCLARSCVPVRALGNIRFGATAVQLACGALASALAGVPSEPASAGAWLLPAGHGQIIAGPAFSGTTRTFDARGRLVPVPYYKKFELGTYVEYGVTSRVTLVAAPAYDRIRAPPPAQSFNGLGESEFAGKFGLFRDGTTVVSVQAGVRTPGPSIADATGPFDPRRSLGFDFRGLIGRSFELTTMPAFIDVQGGYRYYTRNQPGEWRLDLTFGVRPVPRLLWLVQTFSVYSTASGGGFVRYSWHKASTSIVIDINPHWSIQCGGFMTLAGVNAGRERGPFAAVWFRF